MPLKKSLTALFSESRTFAADGKILTRREKNSDTKDAIPFVVAPIADLTLHAEVKADKRKVTNPEGKEQNRFRSRFVTAF